MRNVVWIVVGAIVTAGLSYASWWVYLEVQQQIRGTLISGFGIFAGVMGAFALLGVAHIVFRRAGLLLRRRGISLADADESGGA